MTVGRKSHCQRIITADEDDSSKYEIIQHTLLYFVQRAQRSYEAFHLTVGKSKANMLNCTNQTAAVVRSVFRTAKPLL